MSGGVEGPAAGSLGLEAAGWGWRHAGRPGWALRGLDLVIRPGERVLLLGASGAGKSTLVQAFAGVLGGADEGEEEGSLTVGGLHPTDRRGAVGLLQQDPDSQVVLDRVGDDVAFGCENLAVPREEIWPRVDEALAAVGLALPRDRSTSALSGGQKQRVALAGIIAMRPGVILLDEPTANLDPEGVVEVRDAVAGLLARHPSTFVVIEHRVEVWLDVVDRVVVLAPGGGVLADGSPDAVLRERGAELARDGVWVPGHDPLRGRRVRAVGGEASGVAAAAAESASSSGSASAAPAAMGREVLTVRDAGVGRVPGTVVARGIDATVRAGEALAVTGPNGAGKSTLALTMAGLLPVEEGSVAASEDLAAGVVPRRRSGLGRRRRRELDPRDPFGWASRDLLTRIGTVFQDPEHQFVTGTVRGELEVALKALGLPADEADGRVTEVAERLRLDGLLEANPYTLSGGEKRRLSVASVLVARPRILVLDEPTFGQDSRTWAELVLLLGEQLDRGTAVIAVTHDRDFIEALADHELVVGAAGGTGPGSAPGTAARPEGWLP
ncbi:ABC transporter ATP-binding protein [Herbiconiux solani]|uniref:ABC transporter ATP-binding protein n=1 Tax=Herbiconiux solani TaxID=661329 RepID=UPI0008257FA9|nr:ABC transporter ATP-binding protein [Herbiconiux solani]